MYFQFNEKCSYKLKICLWAVWLVEIDCLEQADLNLNPGLIFNLLYDLGKVTYFFEPQFPHV